MGPNAVTGPGPLTILSGGQTGADRAALDVALSLGVPCGGWCPAGRRAEDGPIPGRYPLTELPTASYPARTRRNVLDSDGTVVFAFGPPTGGTRLTVNVCRRAGKPCLVIDADLTTAGEAAVLVAVFILRHRVSRLNVAGPRASGQPGIYDFVTDTLTRVAGPRQSRVGGGPALPADDFPLRVPGRRKLYSPGLREFSVDVAQPS